MRTGNLHLVPQGRLSLAQDAILGWHARLKSPAGTTEDSVIIFHPQVCARSLNSGLIVPISRPCGTKCKFPVLTQTLLKTPEFFSPSCLPSTGKSASE